MNTPDENTEAFDTKTARPNFWLRAMEHRKHQLTHEYRATLGDTARQGISDEDYATTMTTLEKMARNLGWDESERPFGPSDFGRGFGQFGQFGPGFGPGHPFGRGGGRRPFGRGRGFGPGDVGTKNAPNGAPEA